MAAAPTPGADSVIAADLRAIPEVESVYVFHGDGEGLRVITIVDEEDDQVYERIFATELRIAESLPSFRFDFTVTARRGRDIDLIMGRNRPVWHRLTSECRLPSSI